MALERQYHDDHGAIATQRSSSPPGATPDRVAGANKQHKPGAENVVVAVRVRRFLDRELKKGNPDELCVRMSSATTSLKYHRGTQTYSFDHCFWSINNHEETEGLAPYASQEDVYSTLGVPVIDNALKGFNSSIIAYGQTGSGKSYSIFGPKRSIGTAEEGLIPRICHELFRRVGDQKDVRYKVTASMIEVYMENVHDLLRKDRTQLTIRGDLQRGFTVPGKTQKEVSCYADIEQLLRKGEELKTIASTALNDRSSRAHTLFELEIRAFGKSTTTSKLTLCDLAGSERCKDAKTTSGTTEFNQACQINMSLLCLGKCVEAVVQRGHTHNVTEFRNSCLTKLLKDSIGGNSKTVILVTVSPSIQDAHTTHQALRFADRAKCIQNHATINEDPIWEMKAKNALMHQMYKKRIAELEAAYAIETQQGQLSEQQLQLEQEAERLKGEKLVLEQQRQEMARNGLTEAEKRRLEQREAELSKRLSKVRVDYDSIQEKFVDLETRLYADSQSARREKEELSEEVSYLQGELEMLRKEREDEQEEKEELAATHLAEVEALKEAHAATLKKREQRFIGERKTIVESMMVNVAKLQNDILTKEEKWRAKEAEFKRHSAAVKRELQEKRDEAALLRDNLAAAQFSQEEAAAQIAALHEALAAADSKFDGLATDCRAGLSMLTGDQSWVQDPTAYDAAGLPRKLAEVGFEARAEKERLEHAAQATREEFEAAVRKLEAAAEGDRARHRAAEAQLSARAESGAAALSQLAAQHQHALADLAAAHGEAVRALSDEHARDEARAAALQASNSALSQTCDGLREKHEAGEAERAQLKQQCAELRENVADLEEELLGRIAGLEAEKAALARKCAGGEAEAAAQQAQAERLARECEGLRAEAAGEKKAARSQAERLTAEREARAQECEALGRQVQTLRAEAAGEKEAARSQAEHLTAEREALAHECEGLGRQVQTLRAEAAGEKEAARSQAERLTAEREALAQECEGLGRQVQALRAEAAGEKEAARGQAEQLLARIEELEAEKAALAEKCADGVAEAAARKEAARAHADHAAAEREAAAQECQLLGQQVQALRAEAAEATATARQQKRELLAAHEKVSSLAASCSLAEKRQEQLQRSLDESEESVEKLKAQVRGMQQSEEEKVEALLASKRAEIEDVRRSAETERDRLVKRMEEDRRSLRAEIEQRETERVNTLRAQSEKSDKALSELSAERSRLAQESIELKHEAGVSREKADQLHRELRHLKTAHGDEIERLETKWKQRLEELAAENAHLKTESSLFEAKAHHVRQALDAERLRRKTLTDELAKERNGKASIMKNMMEWANGVGAQFQEVSTQLSDEARKAEQPAPFSESCGSIAYNKPEGSPPRKSNSASPRSPLYDKENIPDL
ncbi:Kinesin-like protein K39 [Diplonema papillatum]|nr:Kinesin-like protein K39 [Diplonema papillatum]